jgi:hypothetical protein
MSYSTGVDQDPLPRAQWVIFVGAVIVGFSLAFIRPLAHSPSGKSIFSPPTWIDHYWNFMTHPIMLALELIYVCALFVKERGIWLRIVLAGLAGSFAGNLVHKLMSLVRGRRYSFARSMLITSSAVITPVSTPSSSITGSVRRLYLSNNSAMVLSSAPG